MSKKEKKKKSKRPASTGDKQVRNKLGQFLPGISGNPKGKVAGTLSLVAKLRAELEKIPPELKGPKRRTYAQLIVKKYFQSIFGGSERLMVDLLDRIDGKASQSIDLTSEGKRIIGFDYVKPKEKKK